ncbi:MAG: hypothetical protein ACFE8A_03470 [Candidatus Hodarchaeota archaeon]
MGKLKKIIYENWELLGSLAIFWSTMILMLSYSILYLNEGHLVYSLDDAYIHMAMAKNFSQKGVWGITDAGFSSTSSSILYTLLLTLIFLFGPNEVAPLIINLACASLLIWFVYYVLKTKYNFPDYGVFVCLLLIIFFIPLPFLIFTGMEHTIQIFIDIIFIYLAVNILCDEKILEKRIFSSNEVEKLFSIQDKLFLIATPLVTLVRFEGMFLIVVISALFLIRKKYIYALIITGLGFLPIIIFGLISMNFGWYFFPNSVILKGESIDFFSINGISEILLTFIDDISDNLHITVLLISAVIIFIFYYFKEKKIWKESSVIAVIFIFVTLLHLILIGATIENQNLSRYDGYLVALGILVLFLSVKDKLPQKLARSHLNVYFAKIKENYRRNLVPLVGGSLVLFFLFFSFVPRSYTLIKDSPQASNNIYEQPYHIGLFLDKYYDGECVAANDIGAINFHADIECLDLRGLGTLSVAKARLDNKMGTRFVSKEVEKRDCKIAVIFEDKDYGYGIPDEWIKAGEWEVKNDVVLGDDTISFWAVDPSEYDDLIENLKDFEDKLPDTVIQSGNYTL